VQVKTTLMPINLLPPPRSATGAWQCVADDPQGAKHVFVDKDGAMVGYVLTQDKCEERMAMDASMGEMV
jgi:rubredoxin---NAD+ reductase